MVIPCFSAIFLLGIVLADSCSVDLNWENLPLGLVLLFILTSVGGNVTFSSFDY